MAFRHFKVSLCTSFGLPLSRCVEVCSVPFLKRLPMRPWQDRWVKQGARAQEQGPSAGHLASPTRGLHWHGRLAVCAVLGQGGQPPSTGFYLGLRERREVPAPHLGCRMVDGRTPGTTKGGGAKAQRLSSLRPCRPRPSSPRAHLSFQFPGWLYSLVPSSFVRPVGLVWVTPILSLFACCLSFVPRGS